MKKTVLILYTAHSAGPEKPFSDVKYQRCYEALYSLGETVELHLCRAPLDWYDSEHDLFRDSWEFTDGQWRLSGPVKPDLVYDKTSSRSADDVARLLIISRYRFMDNPAFTLFANNKYETSRCLPQHFKPYQKISGAAEFNDFFAVFTGNRIVIKPIVGSGGQGVHIVSREEAIKLDLTFPVIVQEFIDSSHGIPGITSTYHDLRMVFIGDELVYTYIRTPKDGSLLANIAQGGEMTIVPNDALPQSLQPLITDTQRLFSRFPQKTYTIDVMFDENSQPWIIEFNTMPGMYFPPEQETTMLHVYGRLLREIAKLLEPSRPISAVIIFTPFKHDATIPFQKEALQSAYTAFAEQALAADVMLYRSSTEWYDNTHGFFRRAWHWDGNDWIIVENVIPDVIYDKAATTTEISLVKTALAQHFPIINDPAFTAHAGNKFLIGQVFTASTKPYFIITSIGELQAQFERIHGEMVVVKPEHGNGGEGVSVQRKAALLEKPPVFPFLIQEFIDSSAGIPEV
ncbi:MAG: ATP-grasp domain-containing protein, partial [Candidatus Moraniibacteriota bacterium]